jgi:hypothetical protein
MQKTQQASPPCSRPTAPDGWIVSWGGYVATVAAEGAEPFEVTGRYGSVNRQEADGTWKIYRHIFNYIVPPPGFGQEM